MAQAIAFGRFPCLATEDDINLVQPMWNTSIPPPPQQTTAIFLASGGCKECHPPLQYSKPHMPKQGVAKATFGMGAILLPSLASARYIDKFLLPFAPAPTYQNSNATPPANASQPYHQRFDHVDAKIFFGGLHNLFVVCPPLLAVKATYSDISRRVKTVHTCFHGHHTSTEVTGANATDSPQMQPPPAPAAIAREAPAASLPDRPTVLSASKHEQGAAQSTARGLHPEKQKGASGASMQCNSTKDLDVPCSTSEK